jgi:hypothetical protein
MRVFARGLAGVIVAVGLLVLPAAARAAPSDDQPTWVVTTVPVTAYSNPGDDAVSFGQIPANVTLEVLNYQGDFAHVLDPRSQDVAYIPSDAIAPSDPPSRYLLMPPPKPSEEFDLSGVVTDSAPLAVYPTPADEAVERELNPNTWLTITASVDGEDGSTWYRTDSGDFVPADAVFLPARAEDFSGHWLDVDLTTPARVTAYEGEDSVRSFLTIIGAGPRPTPMGVFTILRRVANETMNSDTIGIPRNGPGGYYLTNVLFTQYFTNDGASLHYNYWSSVWGYPGSHGCLGLTYQDSAWLWDWAHIGTPVVIHY